MLAEVAGLQTDAGSGLHSCSTSLTLAQMRSCFSKGPGAKVRPQPWHLTMPPESAEPLSCRLDRS